jgi:hypothetical protein
MFLLIQNSEWLWKESYQKRWRGRNIRTIPRSGCSPFCTLAAKVALQIIKAIVAGIDLICRKEEVIVMALTGAAADNIGGNTYHTSLGISSPSTGRDGSQ